MHDDRTDEARSDVPDAPDAPDARSIAASHVCQRSYLPSLDGLRALGVSMVLAFHVGETFADAEASTGVQLLWQVASVGPAGVDLFFVLSGFLITRILLDARGKPGYFRSFYMRRALRIFPLYYRYLALLPLLLALNPASHDALLSYARSWPWYALYLTNVKLVFLYDRDIGSVQHLWSLAVEEQFYLLWAVVVAALPRRALGWFVGTALALSPFVRGAWIAQGAEPVDIYLSSWTHADGLLAGAGVAIIQSDSVRWRALVKWAPGMIGISLIALSCLNGWLSDVWPPATFYARVLRFSFLAAAFAGLISLCIAADARGRTMPVLGNRVVQRVGALSYGIYVYHFFLVLRFTDSLQALFGRGELGFMAALGTIALASYALASLSFRLVESRALRLKRYFPRPTL